LLLDSSGKADCRSLMGLPTIDSVDHDHYHHNCFKMEKKIPEFIQSVPSTFFIFGQKNKKLVQQLKITRSPMKSVLAKITDDFLLLPT
jgi:hypothetical protein